MKRSEFGKSCKEATATRRLLESFTDGIYLVKNYQTNNDPKLLKDLEKKKENGHEIVFDDLSVPYHTKYCRSMRPVDDLIDDLRALKREHLRG